MFLPVTPEEMHARGWDQLDVILVSGDSYIDSPFIGIAVIGRILEHAGYRVGIIAQPALDSPADITRLGEPRIFWGISAGSIDSMVANYTALKKKRKSDDYTPGGLNDRRPDRAVIAYANLIRRYFKNTCPIVLGGIEASLRRIAHYDYWSDRVRGSILLDAKADYLLYGMAEVSVRHLADALRDNADPRLIRGLCFAANPADLPCLADGYLALPAFEKVKEDPQAFIDMFHTFYRNNDPLNANGLYQPHGMRMLIQNPPAFYPSQAELDAVYALPYERRQHPYYERQGKVKAIETIQFSVSTHRGCYGECNFCAIAVHEGRTVRWRSPQSITEEIRSMVEHPDFKGIISDLGGPTANMYGFECAKKLKSGSCPEKHCLAPEICPVLKIDHHPQLNLLRQVQRIPGVRKVFVASGLRYDMILADKDCGYRYLEQVLTQHTSGQMKVAPEHTEDQVLRLMGKPGKESLLQFKSMFDQITRASGKQQYLTYYLIAAHPGCSEQEMQRLKRFTSQKLKIHPEQVQIFTPTPSTYSSVMYHTGLDPFTRQPIFVEKDLRRKARQKDIISAKEPPARERKIHPARHKTPPAARPTSKPTQPPVSPSAPASPFSRRRARRYP
ncbi:MAG: YgiQ family radical SAM protein [Anaerolineales bacterium]|nr:YgiQ family radical SAM protein [Anaerolineales bacterium]